MSASPINARPASTLEVGRARASSRITGVARRSAGRIVVGMEDSADRIVSCAMCGASAAGPPLSWMLESDQRRGQVYYCDRCAREHLRAIESRLPPEWW